MINTTISLLVRENAIGANEVELYRILYVLSPTAVVMTIYLTYFLRGENVFSLFLVKRRIEKHQTTQKILKKHRTFPS